MKMSRVKQVIELESPSLNSRHQQLTGLVQTCNYCCGNGWFWGRDQCGDSVKTECPMCHGAGQMRPMITIDWETVCEKK